jgi:zinc/manganese transport system substrate-binding protein
MIAFLTVGLLGPAALAPADSKIKVVATIPDLADFARHVGGDLVDVSSIGTGVENIHAIPMKPSFATLLNRADVLVLLGLEAEHAFLPALLDAAKNPKILRDAPGYIDCSVSVDVLEVPTRIDRALGDQHPMGNPHYNLDPVSMKQAAQAIADGLGRNDPEHASVFKKNVEAYTAELDQNIARWEKEAAPLRGKKIVSYHPDLIYFAERFGMEAFGTIEIRAGVPPTPGHIEELEDSMRRNKVDFVIRELHYPAALAQTVADATGAKLVELPGFVGGVPEAKDYISFIDYNLRTMLKAAQAS